MQKVHVVSIPERRSVILCAALLYFRWAGGILFANSKHSRYSMCHPSRLTTNKTTHGVVHAHDRTCAQVFHNEVGAAGPRRSTCRAARHPGPMPTTKERSVSSSSLLRAINPQLHKFAHSFSEEAIPQPCELPPVGVFLAIPFLYLPLV
jgi:hypothetical protein